MGLFIFLFAGGNKAALIAVAVCLTIVVIATIVVVGLVCYHRNTGRCPCTSTKEKFREPVSAVGGSSSNAASSSGANSRDTGDFRSGDNMGSQREAFSLDDSQHVAPPTYSQALTHNVVRL